jgi:CheY-like chemotaxis protein
MGFQQVSFTRELRAGRLILLVEDNLTNQTLLTHQLEKLGYAAHMVTSGVAALESLQRFKYGLILMDCLLPLVDGPAITRLIRQEELNTGEHIPIIGITANTSENMRQQCLDSGMDDFVTKPVSMKQLEEILNRWLPDNNYSESSTISNRAQPEIS